MFLNVFNANPIEAYMFRTDTLCFTYANQRTLDNLGYTLEAMQALTPIDITPEVSEGSFRALLNPLLIGGQAELNFTVVHQRKDGSTYSRDIHLQVIGQGEERTFLAVMQDTTASKQQERLQTTQHAITRLLLELNSLEEAAPYIMQMICQTLEWNVGILWKLDERQQELRCAEVWNQTRDCEPFVERSHEDPSPVVILESA